MALTLSDLTRNDGDVIYEVPGPENLKDKKGDRPTFKMRVVPRQEMNDINEIYTKKTVMMNKNGVPYSTASGEVMYRTETKGRELSAHLLAASLVEPDFMNNEERKKAGYATIVDAVDGLFGPAGFQYMMQVFNALHGYAEMPTDDEGNPLVADPVGEAKNS